MTLERGQYYNTESAVRHYIHYKTPKCWAGSTILQTGLQHNLSVSKFTAFLWFIAFWRHEGRHDKTTYDCLH